MELLGGISGFLAICILVLGCLLGIVFYRLGCHLPGVMKYQDLVAVEEITGSKVEKPNLPPVLSAPYSGLKGIVLESASMLFTGLATMLAFNAGGWEFNIQTLLLLLLVWMMILSSVVDFEDMLLPDNCISVICWAGMLYSALGFGISPYEAVLGAIVSYLCVSVFINLYEKVRNIEAMGRGDFKLIAALMTWIGLGETMNFLLISTLSFLTFNVVIRVAQSNKEPHQPFGPFLCLSCFVIVFTDLDMTRLLP